MLITEFWNDARLLGMLNTNIPRTFAMSGYLSWFPVTELTFGSSYTAHHTLPKAKYTTGPVRSGRTCSRMVHYSAAPLHGKRFLFLLFKQSLCIYLEQNVWGNCLWHFSLRLDTDQSARRIAIKAFGTETDFYEFEGSHYTRLLLFFSAF